MDITDYKAKVEALKNEARKEGKKALAAEFQKFFETYPLVESVRWTQYTPYFNDGDPCTFSRHSMTLAMVEDPDTFIDTWEMSKTDPLRDALDKLDGGLSGNVVDEVFEMTFGDGVEVTATRNGFEVEEYSHD